MTAPTRPDSIACAVHAHATLGEGPTWDAATGTLLWVDIEKRRVHRSDPATGDDHTWQLEGRPGSVAMTDDPDRILVAVEHEVGYLDLPSGAFTPWLAVEPPDTGNRLNDGRCAPDGRFWVGSMHQNPDQGHFTGALHRVDPDGTITTHRTAVGVSNGLAFSPDGHTMYWADTLHDTVWAFDYDLDSGTPYAPRVFLEFTDLPGRPDGACVDETGAYWVACVFGSALLRATPDGRVDRIVELPVEKPTMPAFGGPGLATLFVTSMSAGGGSQPTRHPHRHDGCILALDVGVAGIPEPRFGAVG